MNGLKERITDEQERANHIFRNQLFGIAITEITSFVSRRSLYCSKTANGEFSVCTAFDNEQGNIYYERMQHTWKNGKCVYCGASQEVYERDDGMETHAYNFIHTDVIAGEDLQSCEQSCHCGLDPQSPNNKTKIMNMKFDVIIGNPPYQLSDGGAQASAMPIYHKFVEQAKKLQPRYLTMVIPSRWYAGGKGLDDFRDAMLNDEKISKLVDYADSGECFPGVIIAGGVCYFLWEMDKKGLCEVVNMKNNIVQNKKMRALNEYLFFVRDNEAIEIIKKIKLQKEKSLDAIVHSRNIFELISSLEGHLKQNKDDLTLYSLNGKSYVGKDVTKDKSGLVDKYKVMMTKAMSGGNKPSSEGNYLVISNTMRVLLPKEICTETYLCIGSFDNLDCANNLANYLRTKFFRFLLLQALTSINISKDKFCFIPLQNFNEEWTDEKLYKKYDLTQEEIDFIESMIRPMDLNNNKEE